MMTPRKIWNLCLAALLLTLAACSPSTPSVPTAAPSSPTISIPPTNTAAPASPVPTTAPSPSQTAAPAAATQTAQPAPSASVMGIEMHNISPAGGLDQVVQAGTYWVRRNALLWSGVEPQKGQRNWETLANLESEMKNAAESGLQLILVVRGTPAWAQKVAGVSCGPVKQDELASFASFMHDAVARYSQPPYNVKYWELGNEPDIDPKYVTPDSVFGCWGDETQPYYGGEYYAEMLKAVSPQVKAADPQAQVLVGGLLLDCDPVNPPPAKGGGIKDCSASRFLEGILKNGGGDFFDIVSFHAYEYAYGTLGSFSNENWHSAWNLTGPVLIAKARFLQSVLAANGHPEKGLVNTESGVLCLGEEAKCQSENFANTKAYYVAQAYASALAEGLEGNIWYSVTGWRHSELLDKQLQPVPAYNAFRFTAQQLQNASFTTEITQFQGVKGYEFERGGQRLWVLWSLDGETHPVQLPDMPTALYDVYGATLPAAQQLQVTLAPVFVTLP